MSYTLHSKSDWRDTMADLSVTFDRWGVSDWDIIEGGSGRQMNPSVTLYYVLRGQRVTLRMDKQATAKDNLRVLYLAVEAIRKNEVRGLGDVVQEAYAQLAAPTTARDPYEVLGVFRGTPMDVIEAVYKTQAKKLHPDAGGDPVKFKELRDAYERVKNE